MVKQVKNFEEESNVGQWHLSHIELRFRMILLYIYWIIPMIIMCRNNLRLAKFFYYEYEDAVDLEWLQIQQFILDWIEHYKVCKWLPVGLFRLMAKTFKRFTSDTDLVEIYKKHFSDWQIG